MNCKTFLILALLVLRIESKQDTCSVDEKESCDENLATNKYLKDGNIKHKKYLTAIDEAEKNYKRCELKSCGCFANVITRDLKIFSERGIDEKLIEATKSLGTFYQIINGTLYRDKNCMFPSRCAGIEYFISKFKADAPDLSLVINTRDYPQSSKHFGRALPVFSFSKTPDYHDIMYPAWAFWEGGPAISLYPQGLGRWDLQRESLDAARNKTPWELKQNKAFFRGSRTSPERDNLVLLSRAKSNLVDAQYTKNQAWKSEKDTLNMPPAPEVSLEHHCSYKYLFNFRGVAASFRYKHLFLCGSLVFHVGTEWTEFYYYALKPWIHYIPVPKDATQKQLENLISFAIEHDDIAKKIANRGRDFIWDKLKLSQVRCYWKKLIRQYSKLLKFKPTLNQDLIKL